MYAIRSYYDIKSSYLHLISDTVSSVGVLLGGLAIKFLGFIWIDPIITVIISVYIIFETWKIIKKTIDILMQSSASLDFDKIKIDIEKIDKVKNIHHVHSWLSNEKTVHFEAHIDVITSYSIHYTKLYDPVSSAEPPLVFSLFFIDELAWTG